MTNIETIVSSDGVNELITYALSIPKKFTEEVTEDEMVQLAKYAMAIMVQGMEEVTLKNVWKKYGRSME